MTILENKNRMIEIVAPIIAEGLNAQIEMIARYVETLGYTEDGKHANATPKTIADLIRLFQDKTAVEQADMIHASRVIKELCATSGDRPAG